MLVPRAVWLFGLFFAVGINQKILFTGQSMEVPLSGWRRTLHKWMLWTLTKLIILGFGYYVDLTRHSEADTDYSKYLGPDWRKNKFKGKRVSTLVSNHIGFIETLLWMSSMTPPAFTPMLAVKNFPIGDFYVRAL